jgi:hypothetical protein
VTRDIEITRATQAIAFDPVPDTVFGAEAQPIKAEADSGLPVIFETNGPCTVSEGALVSEGAGICSVTARQPGDGTWEPADDVRRVFRIARAPQEISFDAIEPQLLGAPPIELDASASSGLPISYSATGSCTVDLGALTLLDEGRCSVSAFQAGDADWAAAREVSRSFPVTGPILGGDIDVAVERPGTLIGAGALITSALEPGRRDEEFYAIALEPGEILELRGRDPRTQLEILEPISASSEGAGWSALQLDDATGVARWLAQHPGIHSIRVRDSSDASGAAYEYTLGFDVVPAAGGDSPG